LKTNVGLEAGISELRVARLRGRGTQRSWSFSLFRNAPRQDGARGGTARNLTRLAPRLRREPVVCAISRPEIDIFPLNLQVTESQSLDAQVVSQAKKLLSRPLRDLVLDYIELPDWVKRPTDETKHVLVFGASREAVDEVLVDTERAGFEVKRLLTPGCALAPAIEGASRDLRHLVVATSADSISISVAQAGNVLLERIVAWGADRLVAVLKSELDLEEPRCRALLARWDESQDRAAPSERPADLDVDFQATVMELLSPVFHELISEAVGCLGYCGSFLRHAPTAAAVVTGPLAGNALLRSSLEAELGVPILRPEEGLALDLPASDPAAASNATAAACAAWRDGEDVP